MCDGSARPRIYPCTERLERVTQQQVLLEADSDQPPRDRDRGDKYRDRHRHAFLAGPIHTKEMDAEHARELLERERARIERALADLAQPDREDDDPDPFEAAAVAPDLLDAARRGTRRATARGARSRREGRKALSDGTYGLSVESGEPIPDARLEAIPWAERTAEEQARYEL